MGGTDVRREVGRMSFGATAGSEYSGGCTHRLPLAGEGGTHARAPTPCADMVMGRDSGRLGAGGSGHVRLVRKDQPKLVKKHKGAAAQASTHGGGTGGVSSSLAFTPLAGIELVNPAAAAERARKAAAADGYFSSTGTFTQIRRI